MEISISRRHRKGKAKSPDAMNRSAFLKMLFGYLSGDRGSSIMSNYVSGNKKFLEQWKQVDEYVIKSFKPGDDREGKEIDVQKGPSNEG